MSQTAHREELYEDDKFVKRNLAALVASKVFYHLGEFETALDYALGADTLFNVRERSEYVDTMLSYCLDQYIYKRNKAEVVRHEGGGRFVLLSFITGCYCLQIKPQLEKIVEGLFCRCFDEGEFKQVCPCV